ncbi:hypothetical protein [Streptomyces flavofungini]|uniref:hypothetical protein n=1 Tax=Streptomyces flavofungini TaxID=68200 RepID=UPI0025B08990|nr:hypothetical protein [Streptomyces flavofungini]WJV47445.1 hypothetical protein QUY26_19095 [Streptomyces flavofungini]
MQNDMEQQLTSPLATAGDFAVEQMEELAAPGFMDGFAAGVGIAGGIAGAVALT